MKFERLIDLLLHQKKADYETFMWKDLTNNIRSEIFKQNVVTSNDFKDLVYFIFKIKDNLLILADKDYETLKNKFENLQTRNDLYNLKNVVPYVFII